jgi:hypothetical protein
VINRTLEEIVAKKKSSREYTLVKKRSGRFAVVGKDGKHINGDAKVEILLKEKKITAPPVKKAKEASADEASSET